MYTQDVPLPAEAWIADEPRFSAVLAGVFARAARQPFRAAAVAVLLAALAVVVRIASQPSYVATLTFRMKEGEIRGPQNVPMPPSRIREHITDVVLSRERILYLMEKHGISARLRTANPMAAVGLMRNDIEIGVVRNYFLLDADAAGESRSAHVILSFTGRDRDRVQAVVHDIGAFFIEDQAAARNSQLNRARELSAAQAQHAHERLEALQAQRARLARRPAAGGAREEATTLAEIAALGREIGASLLRSQILEKRAAELSFALDAEAQQLWLRFDLVDESVRALREPLKGAEGVAFAGSVLLVAIPVVMVFFGALNRRMYRSADVTMCGFPLLGTVPRFPGDDAGSYRARSGPPRANEATTP